MYVEMCSINNSNATYCSEVEELLKADSNVVPNELSQKFLLRRSQRLFEKLKQRTENSRNNNGIVRSENVTNADNVKSSHLFKDNKNVFNILDLSVDKEMDCVKRIGQCDILSHDTLSCGCEIVQHIPLPRGVPLDFSMKSKSSSGTTPFVKFNMATATMELTKSNGRNAPDVTKNCNKETTNFFKNKKKIMLEKSCKRQREPAAEPSCNKMSRKDDDKSLDPLKLPTNFVNISMENENLPKPSYNNTCKKSTKRTSKCLQKDCSYTAGEIIKVNNENINNSTESKKFLYRNGTKHLKKFSSKIDAQKTPFILEKSFCKKISKKKTLKSALVECAKTSENISSGKMSPKHIQNNSDKKIQLTNKLNQTKSNVRKAEKNSTTIHENNAKSSELNDFKTKSSIGKSQPLEKIGDTCIKQMQRTTSSQKNKFQSDENISKSQSKEYQHMHQHIKSETFTSLLMNTNNYAETNATDTLSNNLQNNCLKVKNDNSPSKEALNADSSSELKPNNSTLNVSKNLSGKNIANIGNKRLDLKN